MNSIGTRFSGNVCEAVQYTCCTCFTRCKIFNQLKLCCSLKKSQCKPPVTKATITNIKGTSETITWVLQPYNIRVAHKPITTFMTLTDQRILKDKDDSSNRQRAVYKIKCCDCQATYMCETGRNLNKRLTKHK